jgi:hypothetical protein
MPCRLSRLHPLFVCVFTLLALAVSLPAVAAETSRCADCHFANPDSTPNGHLSAWDRSAHGRAEVGCESCHGGDASTFEKIRAHADIVPSRRPTSPLNRANLPTTCGKCHVGPFVAFQKSRHYTLLREGDERVPTCITCHDEVGANRPSPRALEAQCRSCHGPNKPVERISFPPEARLAIEDIREVRQQLKEAKSLIRKVADEGRRKTLEDAAQQAEVPIIQGTQGAHAFEFSDLKERLGVARERLEALQKQLANPK